jgi:predicted methyltransferase
MFTVMQGDCLDDMRHLTDESVDSVVTDPPYRLSFMGKEWDTFTPEEFQIWCHQWALECHRVLRPGGFLLAFGGTRTYHRLAVAIEDAGFDIRDSLVWINGQGFPKSLDVSKAIDKHAGAEREVVSSRTGAGIGGSGSFAQDEWTKNMRGPQELVTTAPATAAAKQWSGWGTALKPAYEPIVMARKPLAAKTVAGNVIKHGTGAINIDGCRVTPLTDKEVARSGKSTNGGVYGDFNSVDWKRDGNPATGRWPANVLLSHSHDCGWWPGDCAEDCPVAELDRQSGQTTSRVQPISERRGGSATNLAMSTSGQTHADSGGASRFFMQCAPDCPVAELDRQSGITQSSDRPRHNTAEAHNRTASMGKSAGDWTTGGYADSGGASRFFYCAKAPKSERPVVEGITPHVSVKPLALMRWLTRLVTPPGGLVLDPFAGTGATAEACELEGFDSISIERDAGYIRLIAKRMEKYEERQAA